MSDMQTRDSDGNRNEYIMTSIFIALFVPGIFFIKESNLTKTDKIKVLFF